MVSSCRRNTGWSHELVLGAAPAADAAGQSSSMSSASDEKVAGQSVGPLQLLHAVCSHVLITVRVVMRDTRQSQKLA